VLGNGWLELRKPTLAGDSCHILKPLQSIVDDLPPPLRGPRQNVCYSDPTLALLLTTYLASIRFAENLRNDVKAHEVLAPLLRGCCSNVRYDALLRHLFSGPA